MEILGILLVFIIDMAYFVPGYTRKKFDGTPKKEKLIWKSVCIGAPLIVVMMGVFLYRPRLIMHLFAVGLLLCAIADIVLEINFSIGGFIFGFGHLCYIYAMGKAVGQLTLQNGIVYTTLMISGTILLVHYFKNEKSKMFLMILYNSVISATCTLALPLLFQERGTYFTIGLGAMGLVISDWLLARNMVVGNNYRRALVALVFYFGGQMLISLVTWL